MARLQDYPSVTPNTANDSLLIVQSAGQGNAKIDTVGQKIATDTTHSGLTTTSKKLVGAINELNSGKVDKTTLANLITLASKSGSIASFSTDIADKLFSCYVNVTAKQAGSGTPSPSNVRAISGWSACNLSATGKNILDKSLLLNQVGWNVITLQLNPNTKYTMSSNVTSSKATDELPAYFFNSSGNPSASTFVSASQAVTITTNADGIAKIQQRRITGSDSFQNYNWQIEVGSTATAYQAFGTTHNIPFNQTVYGGVLDVLSGVLTPTHTLLDLGDLAWVKDDTESDIGVFRNTQYDLKFREMVICSAYQGIVGQLPDMPNYSIAITNSQAWPLLRVRDDRYKNDTAANFKTAVTGVKAVCPLATFGTPIQLTPTEVKTILGQNNIFGDCGDIDLKYLETIGNRIA